MNDVMMLRFLVMDWQEKLKSGEAFVSLSETVEMLGGEMYRMINEQDSPEKIATLIGMDLEEVGSQEAALKIALRYPTAKALLAKRDLFSLMQELGG